MTRKPQYEIAREQGKQDGASAALDFFRSNGDSVPSFPNGYTANPEQYGLRHYPSNRHNISDNYRWGWLRSFEATLYKLYRQHYSYTDGDKFVDDNDLIEVSVDRARMAYDYADKHDIEFSLFIRCTVCLTVAGYGGYPPVPDMSSVLCMTCGAYGPPGNKYIKRELADKIEV